MIVKLRKSIFAFAAADLCLDHRRQDFLGVGSCRPGTAGRRTRPASTFALGLAEDHAVLRDARQLPFDLGAPSRFSASPPLVTGCDDQTTRRSGRRRPTEQLPRNARRRAGRPCMQPLLRRVRAPPRSRLRPGHVSVCRRRSRRSRQAGRVEQRRASSSGRRWPRTTGRSRRSRRARGRSGRRCSRSRPGRREAAERAPSLRRRPRRAAARSRRSRRSRC